MQGPTLLAICMTLAKTAIAVSGTAESAFKNNYGLDAAINYAPLWHLPSGTCMPSAAEDGNGHQTDGVGADNCNINKLNQNCPKQPPWLGPNTPYDQIAGEPFYPNIPTYFKTQYCSDIREWRILYYVYFKKDTGHKSDWEGAMIRFEYNSGLGSWLPIAIKMEQDHDHHEISWDQIPNTFSGPDDEWQDGNRLRNHPKLYFGKFHHSVHENMYTAAFKNTCPPKSSDDYRNNDYQFNSANNMRSAIEHLPTSWDWGQAGSPSTKDLCKY